MWGVCMRGKRTNGISATKNHFIDGVSPPTKVFTFIPKKPTINVAGRKMNVIQDSLHIDDPSCKEARESLIPTDLYIYHESLAFTS